MPDRNVLRASFRHIRTASFSLFIIAFVTISLAASAWAWLAPASGIQAVPATRADSVPPAPALGLSSQERVEAEVITILPTGFNPSAVTRPRGRFLILVDNRSGLDEVTLRLDQVAGHRLREVRLTKEERILRRVEDLPPGEYLLTEADHPDWACRITITSS